MESPWYVVSADYVYLSRREFTLLPLPEWSNEYHLQHSVVQITARTPNPNLQIIINGKLVWRTIFILSRKYEAHIIYEWVVHVYEVKSFKAYLHSPVDAQEDSYSK